MYSPQLVRYASLPFSQLSPHGAIRPGSPKSITLPNMPSARLRSIIDAAKNLTPTPGLIQVSLFVAVLFKGMGCSSIHSYPLFIAIEWLLSIMEGSDLRVHWCVLGLPPSRYSVGARLETKQRAVLRRNGRDAS